MQQSDWTRYENVVNNFAILHHKQGIIWDRYLGGVSLYGEEDDEASANRETITLEGGLVDYNVFRTWPTSVQKETGSIDNQSQVLILNKVWLSSQGYLNANSNFDFTPERDYFTVDGIEYTCEGFTSSSQTNTKSLFINLILSRKEVSTPGPTL
jgi:hypothetical protein